MSRVALSRWCFRVILALACSGALPAGAGTEHEVWCSARGCGFRGAIGLGGGMAFEQASGVCGKCEKIVSATWKRGSGKKPRLHAVWDALTGKTRQVVRCPGCRGGFVEIESIEEFRHCPKCQRPSIRSRVSVLYD